MSSLRKDIIQRKEDIQQWIDECRPKAFICKQLNCKPETLNSHLKRMNIEYKGNQGGRGIESDASYIKAIDYAKKDLVQSNLLRKKLIRDGIKEYKCELCGLSEWQHQPIPLELHHKDGNHYNNELCNLQILCPNCHALQPNNSGKAADKEHLKIRLDRLAYKRDTDKLGKLTHERKTIKKEFFCVDCGVVVSTKGVRCKSCAAKIKNLKNRKVKIDLQESI